MFWTSEKIGFRIRELAEYRYRDPLVLGTLQMRPDTTGAIGEAPPPSADGDWRDFPLGGCWTGYDAYAWFRTEIVIPEAWAGKRAVGRFDFGRTYVGNIAGFESLLYLDGQPYQGVDSNHQEVFFPEGAAGCSFSLCFRVWSSLENHEPILFNKWPVFAAKRRLLHEDPLRAGAPEEQRHTLSRAELAWLDEDADDLYYLSRAAHETMQTLAERDPTRHALLAALDRAFARIDWSRPGSAAFYASISSARRALHEELERLPKQTPVTVTCIGHTHIDVAWLWQLKHTREKAARSFSTALRLMEQFPEYVFLQTQPQLYEYIKADYPQLYERIKARIAEGRWEVEGGMWLEADCNLPSGEALVRQFLYGTRFIAREFGMTCKYLWLPDVFGYCAALPQIMKQSGIESFMTCKINMFNQYNEMPHHTFRWRGLDGTEVLTHFAGNNYSGVIAADWIHGLWERYKDKALNRELLFAYGYGDGGGGANRDMLEMRRRLEGMPGMPRVETGRADAYFRRLHETVADSDQYVHTWEGELYFEYHRGTYTSQAFVKKLNRRCELALREAEWLNVLSGVIGGDGGDGVDGRDGANGGDGADGRDGADGGDGASGRDGAYGGSGAAYPSAELDAAWKIVLRNQFHDILPGSSTREVYEDCRREYGEALELIGNAVDRACRQLVTSAAGEGVFTIFNGASWSRSDIVRIAGSPGLGAAGFWQDERGAVLQAQHTAEGWLVRVEDVPPLGCAVIRRIVAEQVAAEFIVAAEHVVAEAVVAEPAVAEPVVAEAVAVESAVGSGDAPVPFAPSASGITTPFYELAWNGSGQLTRLYDRETGREVLAAGERGNVLQVFEDKPLAHDAWDIEIYYRDKRREIADLRSVGVTEIGPLRAVVRFEWAYGESSVIQDMVVYSRERRIDFVSVVDWRERQQLLKTAFRVDVKAPEATYDVQFGNVKRPTHWNTSWDYARFEVVGHQWADLSEHGYGVSLLNDCKYGYDIKENVMRLSLIRSPIYPDHAADQGLHAFTYALLPHAGAWFEGGTAQAAWRLNDPLRVCAGAPAVRSDFSLFRISANNLMVDAVKKAEEGEGIIVRFHEYAGARVHAEVTSDLPIASWQECDLMERPIGEVRSEPAIRLFVKPYEIKTVCVKLAAGAEAVEL